MGTFDAEDHLGIAAPGLFLPTTYYCACCGSYAEDAADAAACCRGMGKPAIGYLCPVCMEPYDTEAAALACHQWNESPEGLRRAHHLLEEAGQLTLELIAWDS